MKFFKNKETIESANNFLKIYGEEAHNPFKAIVAEANEAYEDVEVEVAVDELDSIKDGIDTTTKALDEVNNLADNALAEIKPVLKKYNILVTVMQIITVIASGTIVGIVFAEKAVPIVIAILTLTTSIGSYIAKYYMSPLFGGELNRRDTAYKLVGLKGKSVGLKLALTTIIISDQNKEQIQQHINNAIDLVGEMHALFTNIK